ncbi:MAG: urease accessory protein UreE [Campylobacteraceae bacterium]|jgi:urease accessory protein|nr:urease accessory protein UreE [Campylobacteraceae bacterium]
MIKKIVKIEHSATADDSVQLAWYDLQKPHLSAVTKKGVSFALKQTHLHSGDILVAEDGYKIEVIIEKAQLYIFLFQDAALFAASAYRIGNRHQPIAIRDMKITALDDPAIADIVEALSKDESVCVTKEFGVFHPNVHAPHTH